jgi:hypothetical protein
MGKGPQFADRDYTYARLAMLFARSRSVPFPLVPQPPELQGTQIIDPQNLTHVATASGQYQATVVDYLGIPRTGRVWIRYADLVSAWGTLWPLMTEQPILVQVSNHTDNSDPVLFCPVQEAAHVYSVYLGGAPTILRTDTLAVTSQKNSALGTNAMLSTELNAASVSSTRLFQIVAGAIHSVAWSYAPGGAAPQWLINQPQEPQGISPTLPAVEVNNWANGQAVQEVQAVQVNLALVRGTALGGDGILLLGFDGFDPEGGGESLCLLDNTDCAIVCSEVKFNRYTTWLAAPGTGGVFCNCCIPYAMSVQGLASFFGCMWDPATMFSWDWASTGFSELDFDCAIGAAFEGAIRWGPSNVIALGPTVLDTLLTLTNCELSIQSTNLTTPVLYSAGTKSNGASCNISMEGFSAVVVDTIQTTNAANAITYPTANSTGIYINGANDAALHATNVNLQTYAIVAANTPANLDASDAPLQGIFQMGGSVFKYAPR